MLIADGHHRYAISRTYRDEVRASTGRNDTGAELTMTYVAELVEEQLSIDPIHRVYRGISGRCTRRQHWPPVRTLVRGRPGHPTVCR